jgi:hypothetical protein
MDGRVAPLSDPFDIDAGSCGFNLWGGNVDGADTRRANPPAMDAAAQLSEPRDMDAGARGFNLWGGDVGRADPARKSARHGCRLAALESARPATPGRALRIPRAGRLIDLRLPDPV